MSTKTLRKRIALATVAALGAGVLSLVSMPAAQASVSSIGSNQLAGTLQTGDGAATTGRMFQATGISTTGAAVTSATSTSNLSVGLVNTSDIAGGLSAGTTQTAVLVSTGTLVVFGTGSSPGASAYDVVTVTGGTITSATGMGALNAGSTVAGTAANSSAGWGVAVKPNSGATSMTIALSTASSSQTSNLGGTLTGYITVTIAASSTAGTYSAATSGVWYASAASGKGSLTADDTTTSAPNAPTNGTAAYGQAQYATIRVRDAFGTAITSASLGLLQASATNGALVAIASGAGTPTASTAFLSSTIDGAVLTVKAPASAPVSTVVTVSYNGTVIANKSFTFTGSVAKITLSAPSNGAIGATATSTGTATIAFADAAGNAVYPSTSASTGSGNTYYPHTGFAVDGTSLNAYITNASVQSYQWPTSTSAGVLQFFCGASAGTANLAVKYSNVDGTVVTSNALPVSCSGSAYTYAAKLDKSTYAPGEVATLTVTFKDSKGNLANDVSTIANSSYVPQVAGGYLTPTTGANTTQGGTAGTSSDYLTNGVITYKFVVGAPTLDPYAGQLLVSNGYVNANGLGDNQTVSYKIVSGQTSLNDVLKGIVSLIASINKQIAALAKLVAPKKKK